jgi:hypothetical protein
VRPTPRADINPVTRHPLVPHDLAQVDILDDRLYPRSATFTNRTGFALNSGTNTLHFRIVQDDSLHALARCRGPINSEEDLATAMSGRAKKLAGRFRLRICDAAPIITMKHP